MEEVQYVTPTLESWTNPVDSSMASWGSGRRGSSTCYWRGMGDYSGQKERSAWRDWSQSH